MPAPETRSFDSSSVRVRTRHHRDNGGASRRRCPPTSVTATPMITSATCATQAPHDVGVVTLAATEPQQQQQGNAQQQQRNQVVQDPRTKPAGTEPFGLSKCAQCGRDHLNTRLGGNVGYGCRPVKHDVSASKKPADSGGGSSFDLDINHASSDHTQLPAG